MKDLRPAQTISIVVPLYDEQENIRSPYASLTQVLERLRQPYEVIFVDDGSHDQTGMVLDEICEQDARVSVLRLRRNFGQAAALQGGFDFAQGDIVISMDGDLQHDPEDIPQFLIAMAEGYDIVSGWRVKRQDAWLTRQLPSACNTFRQRRVPTMRDERTYPSATENYGLPDEAPCGILHCSDLSGVAIGSVK